MVLRFGRKIRAGFRGESLVGSAEPALPSMESVPRTNGPHFSQASEDDKRRTFEFQAQIHSASFTT